MSHINGNISTYLLNWFQQLMLKVFRQMGLFLLIQYQLTWSYLQLNYDIKKKFSQKFQKYFGNCIP